MKKIVYGSVITLLLCPALANGQNIRVQLPPGYNKIVEVNDITPGREGTPFLPENFVPGTIQLWNGKTVTGLSFRYDVLNNEMQYFINNTAYIIGSPDSLKELSFGGRSFIWFDFSGTMEGEKGYYEVLVPGKSVLLSKHYIEIQHANYNVALSTGSKNDKLLQKETFYMLGNGQIRAVDKKGKNLADVFADKYNDVMEFAKKSDLSFRKKEDLVKIVEYYNGL